MFDKIGERSSTRGLAAKVATAFKASRQARNVRSISSFFRATC